MKTVYEYSFFIDVKNLFSFPLMGNKKIQAKIPNKISILRYEDVFKMCCKIFLQYKKKLKPDNTWYELFCVVNIKMALVEQEITP